MRIETNIKKEEIDSLTSILNDRASIYASMPGFSREKIEKCTPEERAIIASALREAWTAIVRAERAIETIT